LRASCSELITGNTSIGIEAHSCILQHEIEPVIECLIEGDACLLLGMFGFFKSNLILNQLKLSLRFNIVFPLHKCIICIHKWYNLLRCKHTTHTASLCKSWKICETQNHISIRISYRSWLHTRDLHKRRIGHLIYWCIWKSVPTIQHPIHKSWNIYNPKRYSICWEWK
jgi:hypothetical protein